MYLAFLYTEREKVSEWELSDDFGTAHGPFLLSAKPWFGDSQKMRNKLGQVTKWERCKMYSHRIYHGGP